MARQVSFGIPSRTEWESTVIIMHLDLQSLITPRNNLQPLVEPFETEEINNIVKKMPIDKAPGPDGFNGLFLKKC